MDPHGVLLILFSSVVRFPENRVQWISVCSDQVGMPGGVGLTVFLATDSGSVASLCLTGQVLGLTLL